jgi:hypothetical protein
MAENNNSDDGFGDDLTDFGAPMDFQMPDLSGIGRTMKLMSWLPAMLSSVSVFFLAFFGQIVYHGLTDGEHYVSKADLMWWFVIAFVASIVVAVLVKVNTGRQMKNNMPFAV